jgi:hypothetical protein
MTDSSDPNSGRLEAVDSDLLTPIVQKALEAPQAALLNWSYQPVGGGFGGGLNNTAIYRFMGDAQVHDDTQSWSIILKIIRARPDDDPDSTHYWKREIEIYQSGFLEDLPPGRFSAARSFGVIEYPDEACWVWMEDVKPDLQQPWPLDHFGLVARHLGQFNGAYLTTRPIPSAIWLSTGWLRKIAQATEPHVARIQNMLTHPTLQDALPSDAEAQFLKLWDERERFLNALDRLPQTFCHQDPVARNLFARRATDGHYDTVAIDWAFVGQAAVGMDLAVPIIIGIAFMEIRSAEASEVTALMYEQYLAGLRDSGWEGDPRLVRLGFTASTACKYIETLMISSQFMTDPNSIPVMESIFGHPYREVIQEYGALFRFAFALADEARELMTALGM